MATPNADQTFLFPELGPPPALKVIEPKAVYGHYNTKGVRHACTRCVIACYDADRAGRPRPLTRIPRFRRQFGRATDREFEVWYLCDLHKPQVEAEDRAAGRLAKPAPAAARRAARVTA